MSTATAIQIRHRWTGAVLYEGEAESLRVLVMSAVAGGADLRDADLRGADLGGADLEPVKRDFFDVLLRAPHEIAGLRLALTEGRINGSTYEGECACLVGTIANVRKCHYEALGNLAPDGSRPIERFFFAIQPGDTPDKSQFSQLAVEWLDEFSSLASAFREVPA